VASGRTQFLRPLACAPGLRATCSAAEGRQHPCRSGQRIERPESQVAPPGERAHSRLTLPRSLRRQHRCSEPHKCQVRPSHRPVVRRPLAARASRGVPGRAQPGRGPRSPSGSGRPAPVRRKRSRRKGSRFSQKAAHPLMLTMTNCSTRRTLWGTLTPLAGGGGVWWWAASRRLCLPRRPRRPFRQCPVRRGRSTPRTETSPAYLRRQDSSLTLPGQLLPPRVHPDRSRRCLGGFPVIWRRSART